MSLNFREAVTNKRILEVDSNEVEEIVAFQPDTSERQSIIRAFFTPLGNATSEPDTSELYTTNPLPQLKHLSKIQSSDWEIHQVVDGYYLKLWESTSLPSFAHVLKERLDIDPSMIVFFVRVTLLKEFHGLLGGRTSSPPLSAFIAEGDEVMFKNKKTGYNLIATLKESSIHFSNGQPNSRKTGFLAFAL